MKPHVRIFSLNAALCTMAFASIAAAQSTTSDKASAEALFNEGASLVADGSYAEGCNKFEGSQQLEPTLGTELHLADCYERMGKTASAWALFKESQGLARKQGDSEREEVARQRADQLVPKLSYLTIEVEGQRPVRLVVTRNGREVPLASLGVAIPVDPGTQNVTASASSYRAWAGTVEVSAGAGSVHLLVPPLHPLPAQPLAKPRSNPPPVQATSSAQSGWGIGASAVGFAAVLSGAGLGLWAKREYDRSRLDSYCPTDSHNGCTSDGLALRQSAQRFANASTITLVAGAAVLTTGIVLWSSAPSRRTDLRSTSARLSAAATADSFGTTLEATW